MHFGERYYTPKEDGLQQDWVADCGGKIVWCNPPYHLLVLGQWVEKSWRESQRGCVVVAMLPFWKTHDWFWTYVKSYAEVRYPGALVILDGFGPKTGKQCGNIPGPTGYETIIAVFRKDQKGFTSNWIEPTSQDCAGPVQLVRSTPIRNGDTSSDDLDADDEGIGDVLPSTKADITARAIEADWPITKWLNKVHHGDCLEVMKSMPENSIDLIVTSPPYNLRNSTGGGMTNGSGSLWDNAPLSNGYADGNTDDMPYENYVAWQRTCLAAMMRLLKDDGALFYNHKWRVQDGLLQDRHDIVSGFPVRQIIIWQRSGGINFNLQYFLPTYEVIYLICNKDFRLTSKDPEHPKAACGVGDVWKINHDVGNDHPAPFPVEIPKRCIESTDATIVLDPFIGSGTTAIAAKMLGVNWIGIEISKQYCKSANDRISSWEVGPPKNG